MRRIALALAALLFLPSAAAAGSLEKSLRNRWVGAWVVMSTETYSDCRGMHTNNRVNGEFVKSKGYYRFAPGEIAKLNKIEVHRSRIDVYLSLAEPLRVSRADGPFTLYDRAHCKLELEFPVARATIKRKNIDRAEESLFAILDTYTTESAARESTGWNGREVEPFPADYDLTLARHAAWAATRKNDAVQAKLDEAYEVSDRLTDRVTGDSGYLEGFARGIEAGRAKDLTTCSRAMATPFASGPRRSSSSTDDDGKAEALEDRGFRDGKNLVLSLEMMRRLPDCFVPVPEVPVTEVGTLE